MADHPRLDRVVLALRDEGRQFSSALDTMSATDGELVTNCPPWTLAELVVHTAGSIRLPDFRDASSDAAPHEPADYYRRPERNTGDYRRENVRQTQEAAVAVLENRSVAQCFDDVLGRTLKALADADLDRVVEVDRVGAMRLTDWLITRVISVAAHGLDVAMTVDRPAWTTPQALRTIRPVFVSLLGGEPPAALGWSDQQFFRIGTGRARMSETERTALGPLAGRFPLLS